VIEQDGVSQNGLLGAVIAVIRGEDGQALCQLGQLTRIIILQGTAHQQPLADKEGLVTFQHLTDGTDRTAHWVSPRILGGHYTWPLSP
jgi:hypothetical protein